MDFLRVEYDVTGLRQDEIDYLAGEATAQGESSDGHPDVPCTVSVDRGVLLNDAVVAAALAELDAYGASDRFVSQLTKLEARALAHAVRRLGGCTGYFDDDGRLMHDGETCPVHEDGPAADGPTAENRARAADALRAYIAHDRDEVVRLTAKMPEIVRADYTVVHDEALAALEVLLAAGEPADVVVHLSGADVVGIDVDGAVRAEVRQHHADHMDGLGAEGEDRHGRYEVMAMVAAVSAAAPVTAGPPPGPAVHRGVRAWAEITDLDGDEGDRHHVVVRFFVDPPPSGYDRNVHTANMLAPEGPTDA